MIVAAAKTARGHAQLLALDCHPSPGGVRVGRLIVAADLPAGAYAGEQIQDIQRRTAVTVNIPAYESGIHRDVLLEVHNGAD